MSNLPNLNPVINGMYNWQDRAGTSVQVKEDGSVVIYQGDQEIHIEHLGFFRDVTKVYDLAIQAMPESEQSNKLIYRSMGTSRSLPFC
jgi:hypothetical protein